MKGGDFAACSCEHDDDRCEPERVSTVSLQSRSWSPMRGSCWRKGTESPTAMKVMKGRPSR